MALDTAFAHLPAPFASGFEISAVALQFDGKILASGTYYQNGNLRNAIFRLNPDGSLDPTFNAEPDDEVNSVQQILALPNAPVLALVESNSGKHNGAVRLNPNGSLDRRFELGYANAAAVQP